MSQATIAEDVFLTDTQQMQPTSSETEPRSQHPVPQALKDLPVPPELVEELARWHAYYGFRRAADRRWVEEELKLQYYYGGVHVVCVDTPQGRVVIAAGVPGTGVLRQALDSLSEEERRRACVISVDPWDDPEVSIPSAFFDEA